MGAYVVSNIALILGVYDHDQAAQVRFPVLAGIKFVLAPTTMRNRHLNASISQSSL